MSTTFHEHHDEDAPDAVHAMVLFGGSKIYLSHMPVLLSHMPVLSAPQGDQVIVEVSLSKQGKNLDDWYRDDREATGARFYTVKPLATREGALEPGASFVGDVHRNSYEDLGELVGSAVTVTVTGLVYAQHVDKDAEASTDGSPYLCFGQPGEFFAAHRITSAPSFDQIVSLTILDEAIAEQPMPLAALMTVPGEDDVFSRLRPHDAPKAQLILHPGTRGEHTVRTRVTVGDEIFFDDRFLDR